MCLLRFPNPFQGARVSCALSETQQTVQTTKHFAHPGNWACFLLVGADFKLFNKVALIQRLYSDRTSQG